MPCDAWQGGPHSCQHYPLTLPFLATFGLGESPTSRTPQQHVGGSAWLHSWVGRQIWTSPYRSSTTAVRLGPTDRVPAVRMCTAQPPATLPRRGPPFPRRPRGAPFIPPQTRV